MAGPFSYGLGSQAVLVTLHHDLQIILTELIEFFDVSLEQGARTVEEQIRNIRNGASKTLDSRHIPRDEEGRYDPSKPAIAVDIIPYTKGVNPWPHDDDTPAMRQKKMHRFYYMQGAILTIAHTHGIAIRQGVDWDMDADFFDQRFDDGPHVELIRTDWPKLVVEGELLEMANEALKSKGLPKHA